MKKKISEEEKSEGKTLMGVFTREQQLERIRELQLNQLRGTDEAAHVRNSEHLRRKP